MKCPSKNILVLTVTALLCLGAESSQAAVGLSISPASITNDYSGKIALTITGLNNGQQVQVKRYCDINGSGVIDTGKNFVIQSFKVTDGQLPIIGGVRNLNVPGDDDGLTNGQIETLFDFPGLSGPASAFTGNFIFKVEDQNGATLATQVFSIAQKVQPQGVSGRITSAADSLPVTNAPIALINPNKQGKAVVTLTDTNGNYNFYAPTGSYMVLAVVSGNYVSDENAGSVTVLANRFITNNLALASGVYTISGTLTDASSGKSIGAIFVNGESTNNQFSGVFTDTNGNFNLASTSGQWKVKADEAGLAQKGYLLSPQNSLVVTLTNGSATNINFSFPKATALIYGTLRDGSSNAISGVSFTADDNANLYETVGLSETNGAYSLGVLAANWYAGPDSSSLAAQGYSSTSSANITITIGQAVDVDFLLQGVTAHLSGQVRDNLGNAITNIMIVVQPYPLQGNGNGALTPTTDANGNFDVGVYGGIWNIALECVSAQNRGYVDISGLNYTVTDGVDQNGLVLTFPQTTAIITGRVTDPVGNPIVGVELDANQFINANTNYDPGCVSTDNNGYYELNVLSGTWNVAVRSDELNSMGYGPASSTNVTISAGSATANFIAAVNLTTPKFNAINYSRLNGITMTIVGNVAHTNTIQFSTNLVNWVTLTNTVLTNATWQIADHGAASQNHRFYRAVVSP